MALPRDMRRDVQVRVLPHAAVWRRGRCYHGGDAIHVTRRDAQHLVKRGLVERV